MEIYQLHANDGQIYEFGAIELIEDFKKKYKLTGEIITILTKEDVESDESVEIFELHANDGEIYEFGAIDIIEDFKNKNKLTGKIVSRLI